MYSTLTAPTSPGPKAVVGSEGQEASVVNRLLAIPGLHHDLHVVIETRGGGAPEVCKGADMLANGRREVLLFHEAHELTSRIPEDITESVDPAAPFGGEVDIVGGIVHLCLDARARFETLYGLSQRT